jgi:hypothetical protein
MKLAPIRIASDVAVGLRQSLARTAGVSDLTVTVEGSTITAKARVNTSSLPDVQGVIDDYKDSGFTIVLDRRVS